MSRTSVGVCIAGLALLGAALGASGQANSQGLSPREQQLMQVIEALEKRVTDLENKLNEGTQPATESLGVRVKALELQNDELAKKIEEQPEADPSTFRVYWKNAIRFDSQDGQFKLKLGGRIQHDWAWYEQDNSLRPYGDMQDGTEFRRTRLYVSGDIYHNVSYKTQYDFATGDADFSDVYVALRELPVVGTLRVGQFYEPFTIEEATSDNYITFLERSMANDVFSPHRNTGPMIYNTLLDERISWYLGVFRDVDDYGDGADDGNYNVTGRISTLPWWEEDGRHMLQLGLAYSYRNPDGGIRYRGRPESHITDVRFVDTGTFVADTVKLLNLQGAFVYGPFSLQGEYIMSDVDTKFFGDRDFDSYYIQASYFLTGEHRPWDAGDSGFGRLSPKRNFRLGGESPGWGAWEIGARYSAIDLSDGPIRGGEEENITLGLNWYLNPHARMMINYINADIDRDFFGGNTYLPLSRGGDVDIFQTRFQVDF